MAKNWRKKVSVDNEMGMVICTDIFESVQLSISG